MLKKARRIGLHLDAAELAHLELLIRGDYARARPGDTLDDLKRRAKFSKWDAGLLADWLCVAVARARKARAGESERTRTVAA